MAAVLLNLGQWRPSDIVSQKMHFKAVTGPKASKVIQMSLKALLTGILRNSSLACLVLREDAIISC